MHASDAMGILQLAMPASRTWNHTLPGNTFMGAAFWIKRFLTVLAGAFAIICAAQLIKGHDLTYSATQAAVWATIAAALFTTARIFQSRRGRHCAICKDTPEMRRTSRGDDDV